MQFGFWRRRKKHHKNVDNALFFFIYFIIYAKWCWLEMEKFKHATRSHNSFKKQCVPRPIITKWTVSSFASFFFCCNFRVEISPLKILLFREKKKKDCINIGLILIWSFNWWYFFFFWFCSKTAWNRMQKRETNHAYKNAQ